MRGPTLLVLPAHCTVSPIVASDADHEGAEPSHDEGWPRGECRGRRARAHRAGGSSSGWDHDKPHIAWRFGSTDNTGNPATCSTFTASAPLLTLLVLPGLYSMAYRAVPATVQASAAEAAT